MFDLQGNDPPDLVPLSCQKLFHPLPGLLCCLATKLRRHSLSFPFLSAKACNPNSSPCAQMLAQTPLVFPTSHSAMTERSDACSCPLRAASGLNALHLCFLFSPFYQRLRLSFLRALSLRYPRGEILHQRFPGCPGFLGSWRGPDQQFPRRSKWCEDTK